MTSLRTRVRGFTAWVNLRLMPYDQLMNNVIMDLLTGTNMKYLMESMTGTTIGRFDSFDGLSQQQKTTRVEWMVKELKKSHIIPDDVYVDCRLFAMRSADQIFELMWRMVIHDIVFVWERGEYLQLDNVQLLCEVPFTWTPECAPTKRKKKVKKTVSLLAGFGSASVKTEVMDDEESSQPLENMFPRSDFMKQFKTASTNTPPSAVDCILNLVNTHLQMVDEGRQLGQVKLDDLVDSRVLCALVNSFLPNTFTTEVFLNDRWTINLVLRSAEKLFRIPVSLFDSEDLVENDEMAVCSYFLAFFMMAYKFRQSQAVAKHVSYLQICISRLQQDTVGGNYGTSQIINRQELDAIQQELNSLGERFDVNECFQWIEHVNATIKEIHALIRKKMIERYDRLIVQRDITITEICSTMAVNLVLTKGSIGFVGLRDKESVTQLRRIVLYDKDQHFFFDDEAKQKRDQSRYRLRLPPLDIVTIHPSAFPNYDIFVEATSKSKVVRNGFSYLYQVFPSNMDTWQRILLMAVRENNIERVKRMTTFFYGLSSFVNCREHLTGNTPLCLACKLALWDMVLQLLESGAEIDLINGSHQTPLMLACDNNNRNIVHLLLEWGADIRIKGPRGLTVVDMAKTDDFRHFIVDTFNHYQSVVPPIMSGDTELLGQLLLQHKSGLRTFSSLRSRWISGSTFLHTAAFFGDTTLIRDILALGVDVNLRDYKGASALHRAKNPAVIKVLMEAGISPNIEDLEGNTALHVKCYGETDRPSDSATIAALINARANITLRSKKGLTPLHCAAMQGRVDVIKQLLDSPAGGALREVIMNEMSPLPPSVVNLAAASDHLQCADWLLQSGFQLKDDEADSLLQKIVLSQLDIKNRSAVVRFTVKNGASVNKAHAGGNTPLHYAASMTDGIEVLETLIELGANVNQQNAVGDTPLSLSCQASTLYIAHLLIEKEADVKIANKLGLMPFDYIVDYDEWINCGYFNEEVLARLKAYSLKHTRDLIRAISNRVHMTRWTRSAPVHHQRGGGGSVGRSHLARSSQHDRHVSACSQLPSIRSRLSYHELHLVT